MAAVMIESVIILEQGIQYTIEFAQGKNGVIQQNKVVIVILQT